MIFLVWAGDMCFGEGPGDAEWIDAPNYRAAAIRWASSREADIRANGGRVHLVFVSPKEGDQRPCAIGLRYESQTRFSIE